MEGGTSTRGACCLKQTPMCLGSPQVALKDRPGCSMQGPCLPRNVWLPAPSHHQVPPLTVRVAPSCSVRFCPCPGFHPQIMLQADECHGSLQSHISELQTSEAPVGHSLWGLPQISGPSGGTARVQLPHPGSSSLGIVRQVALTGCLYAGRPVA